MWPSRSFAFGVGPRPSRPRLTRPPEPAVGLPLPVFLIAPRREELPAIRVLRWCVRWSQGPRRALRGVLELDAGGLELVADRVGGGEVLGGPRRRALLEEDGDQGVHGRRELRLGPRRRTLPVR